MNASREAIVDAALHRAEVTSWEAVRLHDVAAALGVTLDDVRVHFREKEDIVDAWFDRADQAMLRAAAESGFAARPTIERLEQALMAWFAALTPRRRVTRQMIANKLEPGHVHYQFNGLLRVSRTVQWLREAAGRDTVLPWRAFEEAALTGLYLATFLYWMYDDSADAASTRAFLRARLKEARGLAAFLPRAARRHHL